MLLTVSRMLRTLWFVSLLVLQPSVWAAGVPLLSKAAGYTAPSALASMGWTKRHAYVQISPQAISGPLAPAASSAGAGTPEIQLNLFDDTVLSLSEVKRQTDVNGVLTIDYKMQGHPDGGAVIAVKDGMLSGSFSTQDHRVYRIMHVADGIHRVEELDHSKFPDCASHTAPVIPTALSSQPVAAPPASTQPDSSSQIDVLVAYTQSAETAAGGAAAIQSLISTAIAESNTGYATSGVATALRLVHTVKVNYDESGGFDPALNAITTNGDGQMDEVHALRNTYAADLVVLLINNSQYCGLGWLPSTVSSSNSTLGFSVTAYNCATGYYSFAHEIGHNMGARHDTYMDTATVPYAYGHGYTNPNVSNPAASVRSIMAYNNACTAAGVSCNRVNHWSASDRLYNGTTTIGAAGTATNNTALSNSIAAIANYRASNSRTLTLAISGTGAGSVVSSPAGISCSSSCSAGFTAGTSVTLTATPAAGSAFAGWSGACSGTGTCTVSMSAAQSVTATFTLKPAYTALSVTGLAGASGSETRYAVTVPSGASDLVFTLSSSSGDPDLFVRLGTQPTTSLYDCKSATVFVDMCAFPAPSAGTYHVLVYGYSAYSGATLTVTYRTDPTVTVAKAGTGTGTVISSPAGINCGADCSQSYAMGQFVTLTATANAGSTFAGWSGDMCSGTSTTCAFTANNHANVTATFSRSRRASIVPILSLLLD